jgi:transposase
MAYRYGDREQFQLLPACIDDYVGVDDPVRAYDAFVEALDLKELGIEEDPDQVGNTEYDPRAMLKLFVYGYSYGNDRSSRKLERAAYHNLSFIWLLGGLKPDHKTIANFRKNNKAALEKVLKQSVRMCMRLGLIDGNILFIDGTKIRANASMKHTWNAQRCEETLKVVDKRIEAIMAECERSDADDIESESLIKLQKELGDKRTLRDKVEAIIGDLEGKGRSSINTTDDDCVSTKSIHGSYAGYNAQIAVDEKNGLIASCDVVNSSVDQGLLSSQVNHATETLGKPCGVAVADGGYSDLEDIAGIDPQVTVLVPVQRQTDDQFVYDKESNTYRCPEGHVLVQYTTDNEKKRTRYRITDPTICQACSKFGSCTKSSYGRIVGRSFYEETSQRLRENLNTVELQDIYKKRGQKVELPFGHLRRTLGVRSFLLRGLAGVNAEMSLFGSAFNIRRMVTLLGGVQSFIAAVGN